MMDWSALNGVIATAIAEQRIVGSVIMISQYGQPVFRRATGLHDREASLPMREDAIFRLASFTKPLVAAAALAMIEQGLLQLDQPVATVLDYFTPALPDGSPAPITMAHLLTHTGGIGAGGPAFDKVGVSGGMSDTDLSLDDNLRRLATVPLVHAPGAGWVYGKGMDVMGGVLATIQGGSLDEAVRHYVTGPLRLKDTGFFVSDATRLGPVYADNPGGAPTRMAGPTFVPGRGGSGGVTFFPDRVFNPRAFQSGGSGGVGTAADFMTFLEALRTGGGEILSRQTMATAVQNQIGTIIREPGSAFCFLGALVTDPVAAATPQPVGTYEWGGIYGHRWFVDPLNKLSVVVMSNTANEGCSGPFPRQVRDAIYADLDLASH
ncbi:serine hydrolase domain-containing protein [uncultured Devosia sp.]|uniref:serine hydrolase domain-containing protein n=1 Tax=uncultured Devosia sp. TaxID=211434 RepID=UPI0035CBECE9